MRIIVTGGAGFIGSALVRHLIRNSDHVVHVIDKLTYSGSLTTLESVRDSARLAFTKADICDPSALTSVFDAFDPDAVVHLAAETHVDRSIDGPETFIRTNVHGTFCLLQAARSHRDKLSAERADGFRFHHVSTDEVYGALGPEGFFTEETAYDPRSPYSASKAASDHLVRAWGHTYGLPVLITNCSNNYGPYHFPEKLIPLMILKALAGEPLPVYGSGTNVRDWLYVKDHARALRAVLESGTPGRTYNIGGNEQLSNLEVVRKLCATLDRLRPRADGNAYASQIAFVEDRPGHDFRYAINATRIKTELGWEPLESFDSGLEKTVRWYLDRQDWWTGIMSKTYQGARLGLLKG